MKTALNRTLHCLLRFGESGTVLVIDDDKVLTGTVKGQQAAAQTTIDFSHSLDRGAKVLHNITN